MSVLQEYREMLAATLRDYGVTSVTLDAAHLDPPCVLIDVPSMENLPRSGQCVAVTATFPIRVIGTGGTNEQAARMLDLVEQVLVAIRNGITFVDTEPFGELPAYTLTLIRQVTIYGGND